MGAPIYTTGEFAKKANVSVRTIRYYDKQGLLKPSHISESGYRLYTDGDFARLQKILTLKYLGFSLDEIQEISMKDSDNNYVYESLKLQQKLIRSKIENLLLVEQSLQETSQIINREKEVDWQAILHLIHMISMEKSLVEQYKTGANTSVRIKLHRDFGQNREGWFPWLYRQLELSEGMNVLEVGCGNGELWKVNLRKLPGNLKILLSDISNGMIQDARKSLGSEGFTYLVFDCRQIPAPDNCFDRVTANHVMFYLKELNMTLKEIRRVLRPDGCFICSTYGNSHMKEISAIVKEFDERINLSEVPLSHIFGLENGKEILERYFSRVEQVSYEDELIVDKIEPILDYILSCHGNQQEFLQGRYEEFKQFMEEKMKKDKVFHITKDAGVFRCYP